MPEIKGEDPEKGKPPRCQSVPLSNSPRAAEKRARAVAGWTPDQGSPTTPCKRTTFKLIRVTLIRQLRLGKLAEDESSGFTLFVTSPSSRDQSNEGRV